MTDKLDILNLKSKQISIIDAELIKETENKKNIPPEEVRAALNSIYLYGDSKHSIASTLGYMIQKQLYTNNKMLHYLKDLQDKTQEEINQTIAKMPKISATDIYHINLDSLAMLGITHKKDLLDEAVEHIKVNNQIYLYISNNDIPDAEIENYTTVKDILEYINDIESYINEIDQEIAKTEQEYIQFIEILHNKDIPEIRNYILTETSKVNRTVALSIAKTNKISREIAEQLKKTGVDEKQIQKRPQYQLDLFNNAIGTEQEKNLEVKMIIAEGVDTLKLKTEELYNLYLMIQDNILHNASDIDPVAPQITFNLDEYLAFTHRKSKREVKEQIKQAVRFLSKVTFTAKQKYIKSGKSSYIEFTFGICSSIIDHGKNTVEIDINPTYFKLITHQLEEQQGLHPRTIGGGYTKITTEIFKVSPKARKLGTYLLELQRINAKHSEKHITLTISKLLENTPDIPDIESVRAIDGSPGVKIITPLKNCLEELKEHKIIDYETEAFNKWGQASYKYDNFINDKVKIIFLIDYDNKIEEIGTKYKEVNQNKPKKKPGRPKKQVT